MKQILFNTDMTKAVLLGKKTQTRRVIKPQTLNPICMGFVIAGGRKSDIGKWGFGDSEIGGHNCEYIKPPYQVGDILYVRETWLLGDDGYHYKADETPTSMEARVMYKWRPSIHMPKEAARIFLKVTNVRVEHIQDITEEDAIKEGIRAYTKDGELYKYCVSDAQWFSNRKNDWKNMPRSAKEAFLMYWDELAYKNDKTRFKSECGQFLSKINPWTWVIEFERVALMMQF